MKNIRIFDTVVENTDGEPVLLVEVKGNVLPDALALKYVDYFRTALRSARFGMVVDLEKIRIVDLDQGNGVGFTLTLDSGEVLSRYDPKFKSTTIFEPYLHTLVDAWLRDVIYHWKSPTPPASDELSALGLSQAIEGGDTRREVRLEANSLR